MQFSDGEWKTIRSALGPLGDETLAAQGGRPPTLNVIGARLLIAFLRQWGESMRASSGVEKMHASLGGAAVKSAEIGALIERIEREGSS